MTMVLHLYNTLRGEVTRFVPANDRVTVYVCGITPYATTHLGHLFTYATADMLIRYLEYGGYHVTYVQNLTDIDDALLREARKRHEHWQRLGNRWTVQFIEDMQALNIRPPEHYPRATEVIADIITAVDELLEAGVAYVSGGSVYFSVPIRTTSPLLTLISATVPVYGDGTSTIALSVSICKTMSPSWTVSPWVTHTSRISAS